MLRSMTRDSLYAAASLGLGADHIIEVLHRFVLLPTTFSLPLNHCPLLLPFFSPPHIIIHFSSLVSLFGGNKLHRHPHHRLSKANIPREVREYVRHYTSRYGKVTLYLEQNRYFLESSDPEVLQVLDNWHSVAEPHALPPFPHCPCFLHTHTHTHTHTLVPPSPFLFLCCNAVQTLLRDPEIQSGRVVSEDGGDEAGDGQALITKTVSHRDPTKV